MSGPYINQEIVNPMPNLHCVQEGLEGSDPLLKVQAMQRAIMMLLNGEQLPGMFITILQYVLPSEDHTIQKLLLLYLVRACCCCCFCFASLQGRLRCTKISLFVLQRNKAASLLAAEGMRRCSSQLPSAVLTGCLTQETIEKTDPKGKLLPEMVRPPDAARTL